MQRLMNTEFARAASKGRAPYGTFDSGTVARCSAASCNRSPT